MIAPETGRPYAQEPTIARTANVHTFATEHLETIIDNLGLNGKCIDSDVTYPGYKSYWAKHDRCGPNGRASGSVHVSATYGTGHTIIDSITATSGQSAIARLMTHALSDDGETDPAVIVWNEALPTWPTRDAYMLDSVFINDVEFQTVQSATISYNTQFEKPVLNTKHPMVYDWQNAPITISLTLDDPKQIIDNVFGAGNAQIQAFGRKLAHATSRIFFRRAVDSSAITASPYAKASAQHIQCTVQGVAYRTTQIAASGAGSATCQVEIFTHESATSAVPLVWTKDQAIA